MTLPKSIKVQIPISIARVLVVDDTTRNVSKIIRELKKQIGGAIPIDDVISIADNQGISEEDTLRAINELESDGLIAKISDETIESI